MSEDDFNGLIASLEEARSYARGEVVAGMKVHVPAQIDAGAIRNTTGLSQSAFAAQIGVSPATLRNWEQKRRTPEGPARVLLALLAKDPMIVARILKDAA
jgi:putative transcriptional regulator